MIKLMSIQQISICCLIRVGYHTQNPYGVFDWQWRGGKAISRDCITKSTYRTSITSIQQTTTTYHPRATSSVVRGVRSYPSFYDYHSIAITTHSRLHEHCLYNSCYEIRAWTQVRMTILSLVSVAIFVCTVFRVYLQRLDRVRVEIMCVRCTSLSLIHIIRIFRWPTAIFSRCDQ